MVTLDSNILLKLRYNCTLLIIYINKVQTQENKNIRNVKRCWDDDMPESMQTR